MRIVIAPQLIIVTAGFLLCDVVSGTMAAWAHGEISSTKAREGIYHKVGMLMLMFFGVFLDSAQATIDIGLRLPTCSAICLLIMATETYSVVENFARMVPDELAEKIIELFRLSGDKFDYLYEKDLEEPEEEIPFSAPDDSEEE